MTAVQQAHEILACGLRPEGSLVHLATLVGFVLLAWRLSPRRPRGRLR